MELALILLLLALIVAAVGWVLMSVVNGIDRASTQVPPAKAKAEHPDVQRPIDDVES